ncbi:unnamed protein product, partial [Rotaria magnacalcarata]
PTPSVATTIRQPTNQQYYTPYHYNSTESSMKKWNSFPQHQYQSRVSTNKAIQPHEHNSYFKTAYFNQQSVPNSRFNNCRICGRNNHRTIDCFNKSTTRCFKCAGSRDGSVPSTILKSSTISSHPVYIRIHINNQPTKAFVDTGSAISIIYIEFLKTIKNENFRRLTQSCRTANSTPLNIIGQIILELKIKSITTYTNVYVATNLITSTLLGNDWINTNHIHLFGDQQQLTIPDQYG